MQTAICWLPLLNDAIRLVICVAYLKPSHPASGCRRDRSSLGKRNQSCACKFKQGSHRYFSSLGLFAPTAGVDQAIKSYRGHVRWIGRRVVNRACEYLSPWSWMDEERAFWEPFLGTGCTSGRKLPLLLLCETARPVLDERTLWAILLRLVGDSS